MIRKQRQLFYFVGDQPYASLGEAQKVDLIQMMPGDLCDPSEVPAVKDRIAAWMLNHAKEIVDTLTTTPKSRLRARKLHGGIKKKKTIAGGLATPKAT